MLLVLAVLSTGLIFVSTQEVRIARARGAALRARFAAESGARAAVARWSTRDYRDLGPGHSRSVPAAAGHLPGGARHSATVQRLAGSVYLVRGKGTVGPPDRGAAEARAGLLIRALHPRDLWDSFQAALTVGGQVRIGGEAQVDARRPLVPPPPWSTEQCAAAVLPFHDLFDSPARPALLLSHAANVQVGAGASLDGDPPVAVDASLSNPEAFDRLGPLGLDHLRRMADRVESGTLSLEPRLRDGVCDPAAPGNWGDPEHPAGACGEYFPLTHAPGDLEITGGAGQGVLLVDGDLILGPAVRFYGLIVVQGRLLAPAGALLFGAARVESGSGSSVWGGGVAVYSACAIGRALAGSPVLDRPFRPSGRWWVPVF